MNTLKNACVPKYEVYEYKKKTSDYCLVIPIINEGQRILSELDKAVQANVHAQCDIIICDGGSSDGSTDKEIMISHGVNTLLVKRDVGKQGAQLRMGFYWALKRGYKGIITIDGNNKDSIEDVPSFIKKLQEGYDFVQGSRFIKGGKAINTPLSRYIAVRCIHAPMISLTAKKKFTDTTNNFRAYSTAYLLDERVNPFREIFMTYELLAYLSVRADQLGYKTCEIPVSRIYPEHEKTPTKISPLKGNFELIKILVNNALGKYS
ncbi:glycosyltransferase family 2 protein [Anaerorhabdus sp.]|uniref:glycosyltransferase family 2 protein n=1 Tax=Anaerorhabdus sp. TaxID=1872524 RepID=UPI002FCA727F